MKQFHIFCPSCGNALGRHRVATKGASDFECSGCGMDFSLTDKEQGKSMEILLTSGKNMKECFCPMCGPERSEKYTITNGGFSCTNNKCRRAFTVLQGT